MEFRFAGSEELSAAQKTRMKELQTECFTSVGSEEEVRRWEKTFIAVPFGVVFASVDGTIVGQSEVFLRVVVFAGREILLGGIGGVCVTSRFRNRGIGSELVRASVEELRKKKCDVACLNADVKEHPDGLYHKLGFVLMEREIAFDDADGVTRHDTGEMFLPACSQEVFDLIMKGGETLHMGKGYW